MGLKLVIFTASLNVVLTVVGLTSRPTSLYNGNDPLIILNNDNYRSELTGSKFLWVVEFYTSWCGNCQLLAPVVKQFCETVQTWSKVLKVGVADCGDKENTLMCTDFGITAVPTLKVFPPNMSVSNTAKELIGIHNATSITSSVLDYMLELERAGKSGEEWPVLLPVTTSKIAEVFEGISGDVAIFIFTDNVHLAQQLILDGFGIEQAPPIRFVPQSNKQLRNTLGVRNNPAVAEVNRTGGSRELKLTGSSREDMLKTIIDNYASEKRTVATPRREQAQSVSKPKMTKAQISHWQKKTEDVVYLVDLENGLKHMIQHEIALHQNITGERLQGLRNFLNVLRKNLPAQTSVRHFLESILQYVNEQEMVQGRLLRKEAMRLESQFVPEWKDLDWKGCKGSEPMYRGYPCSLWTLFHTLTVSAYLDPENTNPLEVLEGIKDYIRYFFSCRECSEHYMAAANKTMSSVTTKDEAVLWLWDMHNIANGHLANQTSEDPEYPKIIFPSDQNCPNCRVGSEWNKTAVLEYLVKLYSKEGISKEGLGAGGWKEPSRKEKGLDAFFFVTGVGVAFFLVYAVVYTFSKLCL